MVNKHHTEAGFSLIELAITLLLVGLLAVMTVSFTIAWAHTADVQTAKGQLLQAYGMAKSVALRNRAAAAGNDPVVSVRIDSAKNSLLLIECPASSNCSEQQLWSAQLPSGVSLTLDSGATSITLDNIGRLAAGNRVGYQIKKGEQIENGELY